MRIVRNYKTCPPSARHSVLALGNFDGVHKGHKAVIEYAVSQARKLGKPSAVMTFEPHPRRVFNPALPPQRIIPFHMKARLLQALGVDVLFAVHFTRAFAQTKADVFVDGILMENLSVTEVVTGQDFIFGHNRQGNREFLLHKSAQHGFAYTSLAPVMEDRLPCSSTRIRAALADGVITKAEQLLGRPYEITGRIQQGQQRGRTIGVPTANIIPTHLFLPKLGVYAVRLAVEEGNDVYEQPVWQSAAANIGKRPTFGGEHVVLEVHGLEQGGDWYGKRARVQFVDFIRPEQRFADVDSLKEQISRDMQMARQRLAGTA